MGGEILPRRVFIDLRQLTLEQSTSPGRPGLNNIAHRPILRAVPRQNWDDLPGDVRAAVGKHTGLVKGAKSAVSGFSSQIAVTLDTVNGRVFVKGMRQDHARAWTQQCEAVVNPHVVPIGPRLLWRVTADGWDLLGFEHLTGRSADFSPASTDIFLVVEAMAALGRIPCPDVELKDAGQRWGAYLDDPADAALFTGTALLHTDWNHTNALITGTDAVWLVDWAAATRGAAWIDPACWVVWLIFAGHAPSEAEQWAAKAPAWSTAPARALDLFAAAQARGWQRIADKHPHAWTHRLRDAAAQWAIYRTGRSALT